MTLAAVAPVVIRDETKERAEKDDTQAKFVSFFAPRQDPQRSGRFVARKVDLL